LILSVSEQFINKNWL